MADGKRYYWLRLKEDFFQSKRIKKLRKIAGGDTYTIIYLKMQLLSLKQEGTLQYTGLEKSFAEELALDLDESVDDITVTLSYLQSTGLIETSDDIQYFLPFVQECIGSETAATQRSREYRARQKMLHCNTNETEVKHLCNAESYLESEKEIEIEKEIESYQSSNETKKKRKYTNWDGYANDKHSICEGLTDEQFKMLDDTYKDFIRLIDVIDDRLKSSDKKINDPYAYIIKVAKAEGWPTKWVNT